MPCLGVVFLHVNLVFTFIIVVFWRALVHEGHGLAQVGRGHVAVLWREKLVGAVVGPVAVEPEADDVVAQLQCRFHAAVADAVEQVLGLAVQAGYGV